MSLRAPSTHFAGFDWAKQQHHVVIVYGAGQMVAEFRFEYPPILRTRRLNRKFKQR